MKKPRKCVKRYRYALHQGGFEVARVEAATDKDAFREIQHYIYQYAADGPVKMIKLQTITLKLGRVR